MYSILVTVPLFKKNDNGGRVYDKAHACVFCDKDCLKVARHILSVHNDETEVVKILAIEVKGQGWKSSSTQGT